MTAFDGHPQSQKGGSKTDAPGFVIAQPLDAAIFAPFGAVVAHDGQPGRTMIEMAFAAGPGTTPCLWINRLAASTRPIVVERFERHPLSAQTFLPMRGGRWLVIVAPSGPDGQPRPDAIQAFVTSPHQGITYRPGTWHHGLIALDADAEVAVLMGLTGRGDDTEHADLSLPIPLKLTGHKGLE